MTENTTMVPEGMLNAALDCYSYQVRDKDPRAWAMLPCLEAALRWRSKNPWKPRQSECLSMEKIYRNSEETEEAFVDIAEYVQRRMFLAPETEVPKSAPIPCGCVHGTTLNKPLCHSCRESFEAYHRDQKSRSK